MVFSPEKADRRLITKAPTVLLSLLFSTVVSAQPVISSISPESGPAGTVITISGTGFSTNASENSGWLSAATAAVTSVRTTQLGFTVPSGATDRAIAVQGTVTAGINSTSFLPKVDFITGSQPYSVAVGDLDGDGKPDLAVANYNSNTVSVYRNTSTNGSITSSSFASQVSYATGSFPYSVSIGDLDGDGKPDLVVANQGSNTVSVLRNTSISGSITSSSFSSQVSFAAGSSPYSVSIGDLDGDGKPDLAVANTGSNTVSVLRNTSTSGSITSSSFSSQVSFAAGNGPFCVSIGDLDGDGKPDLVVANVNSNTVSVLRNTSTSGSITSSSFSSQVSFATGTNPYSVSIGDLDGDGKPDLAVANQGSNTVSVLRNVSTSGSITSSSFSSQVTFATGSNPRSVSISDLDGDGKPDLALANSSSNTVSVLRNVSTSGSITSSSFTSQITFGTGSNPYSVSIGDLDGDGKPDLAVTNVSSNSVSVLRNDIQTTFPQLTVSGTLNPFSTTVGTPSATQSFTVSGTNLTANVSVNALSGYEYRVGDSGTFTSSLSLAPTSGTLAATTIQVRLTGVTSGTFNGNVTVSSAGATDRTIAVQGTVTATPQLTISGTLNPFSTTVGTPSTAQTYTVSAVGLTAPLLVSAPAGYEIRPSGSQNFVVSHSFPVGFAPTVVEVRMNGLAPGIYNGAISHTSTGVTAQNVSVSGSCTLLEAPLTPVTAQSGIWRQQTSLRGITPLTFRSNATTWLVGFTGGMMRSTNGGRDWTQVLIANHIFDILEAGTNTLYAASFDGIYRSSDGGSTWSLWKNGQFGTNWTAVYQVASFNNQLYAGTGQGVWVSPDFSTTFTQVSSGLGNRPITALAVHMGQLYASAEQSTNNPTVYVLNGSTWASSFSPSFTLPVFRGGLSSVNGVLYVGTIVNGLYRLSGSSFSRVNGIPTAPYHVNQVAAVGTSLFAGTSEGVYRSNNGGTTWTAFNTGMTNTYLHHLAARDTLLIASSDIGLWATTPRASGWVIMQNGMSGTRVTDLISSGTSMLASTFGGTTGIVRSTDEGQSFSLSQPGYFYRIQNTDIGIFAGDFNNLYLSTNNGQSWSTQSVTGLPAMEKNAIVRFGTTLYVANTWQNEGVFRFSGSTWQAVNTNLTTKRVTALAVHNNELFAGTDGGKVFRFVSNSSSWTADTAKTGSRALPSQFRSLVSTGTSLIAATNDGIWERSSTGRWAQVAFPETSINKLVIAGNRIYAVGFAFLGVSYDSGITWMDVRTGLPGLNIHSVAQTETVLHVATDGGLFIRPLSNFIPPTPSLLSISSNIVNAGSTLTIQGANFNATTFGNAVFFGTVRAVITAATATQLQVVVPTDAAAAGGVTLTVRVNGGTLTWNQKVYVQTSVPVNVQATSLRIIPVSGKGDVSFYRLVGQPVRGISPSDLGLTVVDSSNWRMFRDTGFRYTEMGLQTRTNIGEGVWLISKQPVTARSQSTGLPVSGSFVVIPVRPGAWNIITNPTISSMAWSVVLAANPGLGNPSLRAFNGSYSVSTNFATFDGYYVNVPVGVTEIVVPNGPQKVMSEPDSWTADWQLGVRLISGKAEDNDTRLGIGKGATPGHDRFELAEPPAAFDLPSVYFNRPDWDSTFTRFSDDFRPELGNGQTWDFEINSVDKRTVQLEITGLNQLPEGNEILLLQPEKNVLHPVRNGTRLEIELRPGAEPFSLAVGRPAYIRDQSAAYLPAKFDLEQNYPNPFNPATTIRFSLNKPGMVSLSVWDVTGRKVADILQRTMEPGFHQTTFDARSLASGVYLYRLESASGVLVKKMMLVK